MSTTYAHRQTTAQKVADSKAASLFDSSSQSESLQRKADLINNAAQRAEAPRPNNTGMPDNLKSGIESLSGFSMDDVRVHYNSSKPATVQALAYTQGTDIHVAPGQEKHLPHEAWHVAQQMAGRVSPTTNINGIPVNDNAALEHEADVMGAKATQMKSDESKTVQRATIWNGVAQRVELKDYYYHICKGEISDKINPKIAIYPRENNTHYIRKSRGDDLGPGFYMGDLNFLTYYYKKNFAKDISDAKYVYIYYIEKNLIQSNIMDFTEKQTKEENYNFEPNELFQIAMQLGFRYVDENDVNNDQRLLDLLDSKKEDEIATFKNCIKRIYPDKANQIISFFNEAQNKTIWKGYVNDVDREEYEQNIILEKDDITKFFINNNVSEDIAKDLATRLLNSSDSKVCNIKSELKTFAKQSTDIIIAVKRENNLLGEKYTNLLPNFKNFLEQKKHRKYHYLEQASGSKPIQIAIRNDVDFNNSKGTPVELLKMIVHHRIQFTRNDNGELEIDGPKTEFETEILKELKKMENHN